MRWRAIIVVLVLMAGMVGAIAGYFWLGDKTQFRPEIREVLSRVSDGHAVDVWKDSSYLLRRTINQDAFVDMAGRMNHTLGKFVRITDVKDVSRSDSLAGKVGEVVVELEFENGVTIGTFGFHHGKDKGDRWRLVGMRVDIPKDLQAKADKLEREFERTRAPDEVLFKLSEILAQIRDGHARKVWRESAEPFRNSVSEDKFVALTKDYEEKLGRFVKVLTIISSGLHPAKDRAKVNALIEFEKTRTNGLFAFVKVGGEWQLSFFKPLVPEPVIPGRMPGASGEAPAPAPRPPDLGAIEDAGPAQP